MEQIFAQETPLGPIGGSGLGPFGDIVSRLGTGEAGGQMALKAVVDIMSSVIGFMTITASLWFMFQILYAGYEWISSGSDTKKLAGARDRITHGFFGLIIVVAAWSLLAVVGQFLGYDTLINPSIINSIRIR